jgi:hypothetical protein
VTSPAPIDEAITTKRPSVVRASPAAPKPDLSPLIQQLTINLSNNMIERAVTVVAQRAAEYGLKGHWHEVQAYQRRAREQLARGLAEQVLERFAKLQAARTALDVGQYESRLARKSFTHWRARTIIRQEDRADERERRLKFEEITASIGVGPHWDPADDEILEYVDEEEEEHARKGPLRSIDHDQDSLDSSIAKKVSEAELAREHMWAPGTFLNILSDRVDDAFSQLSALVRHRFSALVLTAKPSSPFATWLACKFDLDRDTLSATTTRDRVHVDGAIFLDCTLQLLSHEYVVTAVYRSTSTEPCCPLCSFAGAAQRLASLVAAIHEQSIYRPQLVILACPATRYRTVQEEIGVRAEVSAACVILGSARSCAHT